MISRRIAHVWRAKAASKYAWGKQLVVRQRDRIRRGAAWFLQGRYLLLARLLGMDPEPGAAGKRGTVFIEIDGLGYDHLRSALRQGYMPFLRDLLDRDLYRRYRWRCGLVADTPAAQSGLLYGTTDGIVGFYWFDRATQQRIVGANPVHMRREERRAGGDASRVTVGRQ